MAARGRSPIVVALLVAVLVSGSGPVAAQPGAQVLVRDERGTILARVGLGEDRQLTLRYRNSLYGSLAEERFVVRGSSLHLVQLAADDRAVLDEYYVVDGGAEPTRPGDDRAWWAAPRDALWLDDLAIAATDLGERTLIVPGRPPLELWRLVDDAAPTVVLVIAGPP